MLQKTEIGGGAFPQESQLDYGHFLRPSFYWELFKRRVLYFLIPFLVFSAGGVAVALLWPATYYSSGTILVTTQQIPTELVRPTVTTLANERIQVIQQRVLTRDNLVAVVAKFGLYPNRRELVSTTELTELMRKSILIKPVSIATQGSKDTAIAFTVGFFYENAKVAAQVANELMTRILNEDLRDRTGRAVDTTRFLTREFQRLNEEYAAVEARIAQAKRSQQVMPQPDQPSAVAQLRAEYIQKSQIYSPKHPALQTLKKQIDAFEQAGEPTRVQSQPSTQGSVDSFEAQKEALQKSLEEASRKLAAARLGETLERDQQSEKFEVIEQPAEPQESFKPDRPKMMAISVGLALMAGLGMAFVREMLDRTVRYSSDLVAVASPSLIISIPYIETAAERRRARRNYIFAIALALIILIPVIVAFVLFMPPIDMLIAKVRVMMMR
jgi:uncharacterized protein involved in exopolysaccharide biosynthesis